MKINPKMLKIIKDLSAFYRKNESLMGLCQNVTTFSSALKIHQNNTKRISDSLSTLAKSSSLVTSLQNPAFQQVSQINKMLNQLFPPHSSFKILEQAAQAANYVHFTYESPILESTKVYEIQYSSMISAAMQPILMAQEQLKHLPWNNIGNLIRIHPQKRTKLQEGFLSLGEYFSSFTSSLERRTHLLRPATLTGICYGAVDIQELTELFSIMTVEGIQERPVNLIQDIEPKSSLEILLEELDPKLLPVLEGLRLAENSINPDSLRHFGISGRELLRAVLHYLAPEDQLRKWNPSPELYPNNRPSRRARLMFITAPISNPDFVELLDTDSKLSLSLMKIFEKLTHGIGINLSKSLMRALRIKLETTLRFYLEISSQSSKSE